MVGLRSVAAPAGERCLEELRRAGHFAYGRRRLERGAPLFHAGAQCGAIYAVRRGFFKSVVVDRHGREQVVDFPMTGDLLGAAGIGAGRYPSTAVALQESEVVIVPAALIERLSRDSPVLQRRLHAVLAREIERGQAAMLRLGAMRAEARLASFLVDLSRRRARRGRSALELPLPMTRRDLGAHLGLTLETVSRLLARLRNDGLIALRGKRVRIRSLRGLSARVR